MPGFDEIRCLSEPLAEKLAAYDDYLRQAHPDAARIYDVIVARLLAADAGAQAPEIGAVMPEFLLPDREGKLVSSAEFLEAGPLVVSFNRGRWCSFCRLELTEFAGVYGQIRDLGGEVVSIMPDRAQSVGTLVETNDIPFGILTDLDNGYALSCNLMISLGEALREGLASVSRMIVEAQGNEGLFVPIPATFVIGRDGRIADRVVDADFRKRMAPERILNCLQKIG